MLTVSDISKTFGGIIAVDRCSLTIERGSITGLIGPNGAGKTTLFNVIAGFLRPDSGEIKFDGQDVTGLAPHKLFNRGLMRTFQIPHIFNRMTVLENLMVVPHDQAGENVLTAWFGWRLVRDQDRKIQQKAADVAAFLNLGHVAGELAGNLSGGQKKLLELGRTMMSNCKTVLLDEPGAGVNPTLMGNLVADIARLNKEFGTTFCVIEHDMDVIAKLCDPVIVMAGGRVLAEGSFDDICRQEAVLDAYLGDGSPRKEAST